MNSLMPLPSRIMSGLHTAYSCRLPAPIQFAEVACGLAGSAGKAGSRQTWVERASYSCRGSLKAGRSQAQKVCCWACGDLDVLRDMLVPPFPFLSMQASLLDFEIAATKLKTFPWPCLDEVPMSQHYRPLLLIWPTNLGKTSPSLHQ